MKLKLPHLNKFQAGLIGIILIAAITYGCYTKFANPISNPYTINATFSSASGLIPGSPVRIAGVQVGTVSSVNSIGSASDGHQGAEVSMAIDSNGLPIHRNATFWIRPRIFLEGNFFVDVQPGTPEVPSVKSGYTFPIQQGREPVQFDQLLTSLQANTRKNLQTLINQYGKAVYLGGKSFNSSIQYWAPAYKYSSIVTHDFLGKRPNDLSTWIDKGGDVSAALSAHPKNLENLITDFNTTAYSFARENTALQSAIGELPRTLSAAIPAFHSLNAAFPPLERLATALIPGVKSSGPTIEASLPYITQLRLLVQPSELRGLTADLAVAIPALAKLTKETIPFMKNEVRPTSSCVVNVIYPWSQLTLNDHVFSGTTGFPLRKVYQEAVDYLPGLAGESRDFDPNGPYIRVLGTGGTLTYSLQPGLFGQSLSPIDGTQPGPAPFGQIPPLKPHTQCETQRAITQTELNTAPKGPAPNKQSTSLSSPVAKNQWTAAVQAAIATLTKQNSAQGLKTTVSSALQNLLP
ncbi:MAG TPA: MlaD family protein [Solirubrobacteraceae bacterium]|jgi:ABC-type transporter Mla subunit MlaD|nr:MlaD family protein [Solirubrobacteraceae bacterium]